MAAGTIAAITLGASLGSDLISAFGAKRREKKRRSVRKNFYNTQLLPLLNEATEDPDIDYGAIREAELDLPQIQFQNQMERLSDQRQSTLGQSGFASSGFIEDDFEDQINQTQAGFKRNVFDTDRGLINLQSQIESMVNQNKLQAKQLKYEYLYG